MMFYHPFQVANQRLTEEGSDRDVRHFELEDPSSAINYKTGDTLEILPSQNPSAVDAFIERCNLDPDCYVTVCESVLQSYLLATLCFTSPAAASSCYFSNTCPVAILLTYRNSL